MELVTGYLLLSVDLYQVSENSIHCLVYFPEFMVFIYPFLIMAPILLRIVKCSPDLKYDSLLKGSWIYDFDLSDPTHVFVLLRTVQCSPDLKYDSLLKGSWI